MTFEAKYFGSSGWLFDFRVIRVVVDPWLVGNLSFLPGPWLINGRLKEHIPVPVDLDILLLTQGLADHSHRPTLELFDRNITVVASTSASKLAREMSFLKVVELRPGDSIEINSLKIQATEGASVPFLENGYILNHPSGSLYIEPHGFLDKKIPSQKIEAVFTPVVNLRLPFAGSFINGKDVLPELIRRFDPKVIFSSTTGGDATFTGLINRLISVDGTIEEARMIIGSQSTFINPCQGKNYIIDYP